MTFAQECPHCGFKFELNQFISQIGDLEEYLPDVNEKHRNFYVGVAAKAFTAGHSPFAADLQFERRFYKKPEAAVVRHAIYGSSPTSQNVLHYFRHCTEIAGKKDKKLPWIKMCMTREFGDIWKQAIQKPEELYQQLSATQLQIAS